VVPTAKSQALSPGEALSFYENTRRLVADRGRDAWPSVLTFSQIPLEAFYPYLEPLEPESTLYVDAQTYYAATSEIFHKLNLILSVIGYDDLGACYSTPREAILGVSNTLKQVKDDSIVDIFTSVVHSMSIGYFAVCKMLVAPGVLPRPLRPFPGASKAIQFAMAGADTLYHLARTGCASIFFSTGCALPGVKPDEEILAAYDALLDHYRDSMKALAETAC
jgi:hypothetical protein